MYGVKVCKKSNKLSYHQQAKRDYYQQEDDRILPKSKKRNFAFGLIAGRESGGFRGKTFRKASSGSSRSAKSSATAFVNALRGGDSKARKALGLRSAKGRTARNIMRRKSTGGSGG